MTFPLSIFLYLYLFFLVFWAFFNIVAVYHMFKFGFKGVMTIFITFLYCGIAISMLMVSLHFIDRIDWGLQVTVFESLFKANKPFYGFWFWNYIPPPAFIIPFFFYYNFDFFTKVKLYFKLSFGVLYELLEQWGIYNLNIPIFLRIIHFFFLCLGQRGEPKNEWPANFSNRTITTPKEWRFLGLKTKKHIHCRSQI